MAILNTVLFQQSSTSETHLVYITDIVAEVCIYIFFVFIITRATIEYVRADKPYMGALIGLTFILIIAGLFIVYKLFFPYSSLVPGYASHIPPIGFMWLIYYLTFSRKKRNRFLVILAIIGLSAFIIGYILSIFHI